MSIRTPRQVGSGLNCLIVCLWILAVVTAVAGEELERAYLIR